MNRVSVVVPVHNTKDYIKRCVDSLLNQTYSDIEIILVDNGSIDGSSEICDWYADKYIRVKTYHVENTGVSYARNVGIEKAEGDFIAFCDSDDYMLPDMIEHMANILMKNETDLCIGRYQELFKGEIHEVVTSFFEKEKINMQDVIDTVGINQYWNGGGMYGINCLEQAL